jgi:hypothetical protein
VENTEIQRFMDLGAVLGQNQTFAAIGGRCTAGQVATLLRIREERNYKLLEPYWENFCQKYLKISRSEADRLIGLFQEFGPAYFEVSQLTRVSAETYRALAPAVRDGALHLDGEVIEISPENSKKVAAAVAQLRRNAAEKKTVQPPDPRKRLLSLDRRCSAILAEFAELSEQQRDGEWGLQFAATVERLRGELEKIRV